MAARKLREFAATSVLGLLGLGYAVLVPTTL
jgi:hypothetical protein